MVDFQVIKLWKWRKREIFTWFIFYYCLNDILYKNKVKDLDLLEILIEFMISNIGQLFSANSISKYIKNENRKTTPHTIINYMDYARNAFILYQIKRENIKQKKKLLISDKYYLVDSGFYFILMDPLKGIGVSY